MPHFFNTPHAFKKIGEMPTPIENIDKKYLNINKYIDTIFLERLII